MLAQVSAPLKIQPRVPSVPGEVRQKYGKMKYVGAVRNQAKCQQQVRNEMIQI